VCTGEEVRGRGRKRGSSHLVRACAVSPLPFCYLTPMLCCSGGNFRARHAWRANFPVHVRGGALEMMLERFAPSEVERWQAG